MTSSRLENMLQAIDTVNQTDPNTEVVADKTIAKELIYGQRMSQCLNLFFPGSSEFLQIAVRAQHIKRWHLKRDEFDLGRTGYLKWRKELGLFHAEFTASLMLEHDYSADEAQKTASIIRKEKLKSNADSQLLEDVACIVFLQHYFDDFAAKHSEEKIIRILQKTWHKMSEQAHDIALDFKLPEHLANLVKKALA